MAPLDSPCSSPQLDESFAAFQYVVFEKKLDLYFDEWKSSKPSLDCLFVDCVVRQVVRVKKEVPHGEAE